MVRILGKASSIDVRKVLWTCTELGVAFEREDRGSGFRSTHDPEFLALNPHAMVPVLVDGDDESLLARGCLTIRHEKIIIYLDQNGATH
jgi:glutathione S-transferase